MGYSCSPWGRATGLRGLQRAGSSAVAYLTGVGGKGQLVITVGSGRAGGTPRVVPGCQQVKAKM